MEAAILIAFAIISPQIIPSAIYEACERYAEFLSNIKTMQIAGANVDSVFDSLNQTEYLDAHEKIIRGIIQSTFDEIGTPDSIKEKEMKECLREYKRR